MSDCGCLLQEDFHFVSLLFAAVFACIASYVLVAIHPFCGARHRSHLRSQAALVVFELVLSVCLLNLLVCAFFFVVDNEAEGSALQAALISLQMVLLALPLCVYFAIFGLILYSWATVAHSLQVQDEERLRRRLRVALCGALSVVVLALVAQMVLLALGEWSGEMQRLALLVWCGLLAAAALLYAVYGLLMVRLLVSTARRMRNVVKSGAGSDMSLAHKLMLSALCIWLFFVCELALNLLFALDAIELTPWWRAADLTLNVACLATVCYMYHASVLRLRVLHKAPAWCCRDAGKGTAHSFKVASKTESTTKNTRTGKRRSQMTIPTHSKVPSVSSFRQSSLTPSTQRVTRHQHQISSVTITEIVPEDTEMSKLNRAHNTQLIMRYNDENSKRASLNEEQREEEEEQIVVGQSVDMNQVQSALQHVDEHKQDMKQSAMPPPAPQNATEEYEYEYYEEEEEDAGGNYDER